MLDHDQPITPYFTVDSADRLIDFLSEVFDADMVMEKRYEDGTVRHVRMMIGKSLLMINQSTAPYLPNVSQMHVYVDAVEQVYAKALSLGATSLMEPNLRPHGDRMAGFTDPCDNIWWIATPAD